MASAINCTNDREVYSFHPIGAYAVFADGKVHLRARYEYPRLRPARDQGRRRGPDGDF